MTKNILIIYSIFFSIVGTTSCKKQVKSIYQISPVDSSHISITNASPAILSLQLYLNNKLFLLPGSALSYGKTVFAPYIQNATTYYPDTILLPYININPGYQQLGFGSYGSPNIISVLNNNFETGASYSIFLTDTIIHGKVASVLLKDNIGKADTAKAQIRFLNLSPDAPALDVWAYPNAGFTGYKIFSDCGYLPNDFNSFIKAESFSFINAGPYYFEARIAGTSDVVLGGLMLVPAQDVITIYTKGYITSKGTNAIDVGVIQYKQ
jgi:hypothetical protein